MEKEISTRAQTMTSTDFQEDGRPKNGTRKRKTPRKKFRLLVIIPLLLHGKRVPYKNEKPSEDTNVSARL